MGTRGGGAYYAGYDDLPVKFLFDGLTLRGC